MLEVKCFFKKLKLFLKDVGNERLHFLNLKKVCDERDLLIIIRNFIGFMASLKNEFERRTVHLKKIQKVVQLLDSNFFLHPKVFLQVGIIEFQVEF